MPKKFVVDVDYTTEGWVSVEVEAEDEQSARELAMAKATSELMDPSALGPRHTPVNVKPFVTSIEPA